MATWIILPRDADTQVAFNLDLAENIELSFQPGTATLTRLAINTADPRLPTVTVTDREGLDAIRAYLAEHALRGERGR